MDNEKCFVHGDPHLKNVMLVENKPVIIDPNGVVMYGSRYLDLALIALEFPGYFSAEYNNSPNDKIYFDSFLEGYGEININQLYFFVCLRGAERFAYTKIIPHIDEVTKEVFQLLKNTN